MSKNIDPAKDNLTGFSQENCREVLDYITEMTIELEKLCRDIKHPTVGAHLTLAAAEAQKLKSSKMH